jgi:GntR family transcriptional regulator, transcriptional repressor for pyruvate dehydrogenase complex
MPRDSAPILRPVQRRSLSDAVFEQLRSQILRGERQPGASLPAERALCEALGVNRSAVREALRRLEQAGLVVVRQGDASRVLDYRASTSLDLLGVLLVGADGRFDARVVRGILEMRSALGPDAARLAALRGGARCADRLRLEVAAMRDAPGDLARLQAIATAFWGHLIDGADNVAYRLAFNALHETYDRVRVLLAGPMAAELADATPYEELADAVRRCDPEAAESQARAVLRRGERGVLEALERVSRADWEDR